MSLELRSTKGLSQSPIVIEIVDEVQANPNFFKYLARLFSNYRRNPESLKGEIFSYIDRLLNSPRLDYSAEKIKILSTKLKEIYGLNPEDFSGVRAKILENVVYHFGPVTKAIKRNKRYIEPVVKDSDIVVGKSDIKCDFVFLYNELVPLEFVECKADIGNVIPKTKPFEKAKESHQKKVLYLDNAYKYLEENYCEPKVYFACYNMNYNIELNNLQTNWGYSNMSFVNPVEIIDGKQ